MAPYLKLCLKTWETRLPQYEIILLDHGNLDQYIPPGTYDISLLKKFKFMMQKDAVMVAVLAEHGGIFLDADTIVLKDLDPIMQRLEETETIMFGTHCAFVAARQGSRLLKQWCREVQNRMFDVLLRENDIKQLPWDFFANSALEAALNEIIMRKAFLGQMQKYAVDIWIRSLRERTKTNANEAALGKALLHKISGAILAGKRNLLFSTFYKHYLIMLDRIEYGFIPEAKYYKSKFMKPEEKYCQFWFVKNINIKQIYTEKQSIIGLHHSWTPQWFKDLSENDVLKYNCLLSRTLKFLLANQKAMS